MLRKRESAQGKPGALEQPLPAAAGRDVETHSVRRISQLARHFGARSYLEIGVAAGRTFNALTFERKTAVDPHFKFDISDHKQEGVEFYTMTSDQFFQQHSNSQKFDIIFLDGLHCFQQTLRDFCSSQSCAHDRTVWLIDDVVPADVYSALPTMREAVEFRRRANGGQSGGWHGDVYKVMFAIHDFFPNMRYATIVGSGNPQSLVWRAPRGDFCPVFDSMEAIERLGYFDFLKREAFLNRKSEEDAFEEIRESPTFSR